MMLSIRKMKYKEYLDKINVLEKEKKFDVDINAGEYFGVQEMEENQRYIYDRFIDKLYYAFLRVIVFIFAPIINFFTYDLRIRGRKNLKKVKGAVVVSNHVTLLESLILKQAVFRKIYYVGGAHNNKKGFGGYTIKILVILPLSEKFSNQKNLDNAIASHLSQGRLISIDPEQAMWRGYTKIRPFKNGAFYYAIKNNVPIVPTVQLIRKANFLDKLIGRKFKVTLKILPPVYPDKNLQGKEQLNDLKQRTRQAMIDTANDFYHTETDVEKL